MVTLSVHYTGSLHCLATHGPSGSEIATDAPADNMGLGQAFSPTDLAAASLATCILTTMAIAGRRLNVDLDGATAHVEKHMTQSPPRRIARLVVDVTVPLPNDHPHRATLESAALGCPIHHSLHPDVSQEITLNWQTTEASAAH